MPAPSQRTTARDLYEAVEQFLDAKGRVCNVCTGESPTWDGHDANPPCETFARDVLAQRFAEAKSVPGESEDAAKWRIVQHLFDDVARSVEAHGSPAARFAAVPDDVQRMAVSGMAGVLAQFAQVAQKVGRQQ